MLWKNGETNIKLILNDKEDNFMTGNPIEDALYKLSRSKFRSSFHLKDKDILYIKEKGFDTIRNHAENFISKRLSPEYIKNDGKQTPMKGHPVFIAQHACACCCRGCLSKWYGIPVNIQLEYHEQQEIVNLLMEWIIKESHFKL